MNSSNSFADGSRGLAVLACSKKDLLRCFFPRAEGPLLAACRFTVPFLRRWEVHCLRPPVTTMLCLVKRCSLLSAFIPINDSVVWVGPHRMQRRLSVYGGSLKTMATKISKKTKSKAPRVSEQFQKHSGKKKAERQEQCPF